MPASARLITSVPAERRAQFAELARARGVSVSHLLSRLVHTALEARPEATVKRLSTAPMSERAPAEKYTVRLASSDATRLQARAHTRGLTGSGYIAHLTRAHLRANPPMPYGEFQELKRIVNELSGVRGALAEAVLSTDVSLDTTVRETVLRLLPALKQLREQIQGVLVANSKSWEAADG